MNVMLRGRLGLMSAGILALFLLVLATLVAMPPSIAADQGHIAGLVTGSAGQDVQGVEGVQVTAYVEVDDSGLWTAHSSTTTQAGGVFDLAGLAPGTYRVGFADLTSHGHEPLFYARAVTVETAKDVVVIANASQWLEMELTNLPDITGTVRGPKGPLADVYVTAYKRHLGAWESVYSALSVSDGTYEINGLDPGTYRVGFEDLFGRLAIEYYDNVASLDLASAIVVTTDGPTHGIDAELVPRAPPGTIVCSTLPKISGTAKVGRALTVSKGRWTPTSVWVTYQWLVNDKVIKGATKSKLMLTAKMKGKKVSVRVRAKASGYRATTIQTPSRKVV